MFAIPPSNYILTLTSAFNTRISFSFASSSADDTFAALGPADPTFRAGEAAVLVAGDLVVVVVVLVGWDCRREPTGFATPTGLRGAEENRTPFYKVRFGGIGLSPPSVPFPSSPVPLPPLPNSLLFPNSHFPSLLPSPLLCYPPFVPTLSSPTSLTYTLFAAKSNSIPSFQGHPPSRRKSIVLSPIIIGIKELLEPLTEFKVVLKSPFYQLLNGGSLHTMRYGANEI